MKKQSLNFTKLDSVLIPNGFEKHIDGEFYIYSTKKTANIYINGMLLYDIIYIEADTSRGSIFFYKDIHTQSRNKEPMIEQIAFSHIDFINIIDI